MSDTLRYPSVPPKTLANDLSSTGTLIQLTECNDWAGNALTTASFNTTYIPGTLINDARTLAEFVLIDASTIANATTTGLLIYRRGLKYYAEGNATDLDEVTANKLAWTQGETKLLIGTNPPYMYGQFPARGNDETITGLWQFPSNANTPVIGSSYVAPTIDNQVATKKYIDDIVIAGSPDASETVKGIVELANSTETQAGTSTGATGARLVPPNSLLKTTSAGAGDAGKIPVAGASGTIDQTFLDSNRTIGAVYSATSNNLQITTDADSANDAVRKAYLDTRYFGDGSDGALSISSGTTTLNTANKNVYQYTSVSITGTGVLAGGSNLQNLVTYIYVQGDLTITSSTSPAVNWDYLGGLGGTGGSSLPTAGAAPLGYPLLGSAMAGQIGVSGGTHGYGGGGGAGWGNNGTAGGNGGGTGGIGGISPYAQIGTVASFSGHYLHFAAPGAGGAGGQRGNNVPNGDGGVGGKGGGSIVFIVGGNINLTSTLVARGGAGTNGATGAASSGGGGGGGGGGSIIVLYLGSVTANTATFTVTAGSGGTPGTSAGAGGAGGAGFSAVKKIILPTLLI